ncbi:MAG: hypothetical protein KJ799_12275 [Bacteroidetes bacterium]|nr:hypothetical protein [Bacteroidota bacterium]
MQKLLSLNSCRAKCNFATFVEASLRAIRNSISELNAKTFLTAQPRFNNLIGNWEIISDKNITLESWEMINQESLVGCNFLTNTETGDTLAKENLAIIKLGEKYFYIADVSHNQYPTPFELIAHDSTKFIFENILHDYPQRIEYLFIDNDSLTVSISKSDGSNYSNFHFKRKKDE